MSQYSCGPSARNRLGKRCTSWSFSSWPFQSPTMTRPLVAPRSTAAHCTRFIASAQERLGKAAVDRQDLARGLREAPADEKEIGFRLVRGGDRGAGERAVRVELGEPSHERFGRLVVGIRNLVLCERADDP